MAVLFRPKHPNQFGAMARVGHSLTFAVGANERPLWGHLEPFPLPRLNGRCPFS